MSERLCDTVVVLFALWTICCHAIVAAGRGLLALLVLSGTVLAAYLVLRFTIRTASPEAAQSPALGESLRRIPWIVRAAALLTGAVVALDFGVRPDVFLLWWSAVLLLGVAAVAICRADAPSISPPARDRSSETLLWLLAALAVVLTLVCHRPDIDDAFYVNVAVATADTPGRALLSVDTMHGIPGLPLYLPVYRVHSFELLNGALSYLTGIPAIYFFHWVSASCAALLAPLAYARLMRILTPRQWLAAVASLMVILVAAGETHRWYGNFAFVRLWQGKSIFLVVFLPLVYAYALRFAARPNRRDWMMLAAAQIAAVGCTSSALWAAPVAAVSALCSAVRPSRSGLKILLLGALASLYVVGAAWFVRATVAGAMPGTAGPQEIAYSGPALQGALVNVLGKSRLLLFGIVALLTGWIFVAPGLGRRFAAIVPLVILLGLLNPYLGGLVTANVTGPAYWRSMWALPLPIIMALVLSSPLRLADAAARPAMRRALWLGVLTAFAVWVPQYGGLGVANFVHLHWPTLKVQETDYRWAAAVNESVPPGSYVLVPSGVAAWIVTFPQHAYPGRVRNYLHVWGTQLTQEDLRDRMLMQRFVDTPDLIEATPQQFRDGLDRVGVRAVCLVSSPTAVTARTILRQENFLPTRHDDVYELWVRPEQRRRASTWKR